MTMTAEQIIGNAVGDEAPEIAPEDLAEEQPANEGDAQEGEEQQPEEEARQEEQQAESKDVKGLAFFNKDLFTDDALNTPEGIAKARQAIKDRDKFTGKAYVKLKARDRKSAETKAHVERLNANALMLHQRQQADVEVMRSGDANQRLDALGRLFHMPGIDAYELLSEGVLGVRKKGPKNETEAVKRELEELRNGLKQKEQREAEERANHQILLAESRIATLAQTDAFPSVAHFAKQSRGQLNEIVNQVKRACIDHWDDQVRRGVQPIPLDHSAALGQLEQLLKPHAAQTGVNPDAGREPSRNPKPVPTGRTVSPARASPASSRRSLDDMSDEERRADLARDTDALRRFGLV
jgi:hypothetical protein